MDVGARDQHQLALALGHDESFAREDFLVSRAIAAALDLVERWPDWPGRIMVLVGPEGAGKSHLAAIWAGAAGARLVSARALDESAVPGALAAGALVIEELMAGAVDERALFHLLNLAREQNAYVLITARTLPAGFDIALPDLGSRLRALPVVTLAAPDDALLRGVLAKLFADRQLTVDATVIDFLLARMERSVAAAAAIVAALDQAALSQKRPVTRALAAELLRDHDPS